MSPFQISRLFRAILIAIFLGCVAYLVGGGETPFSLQPDEADWKDDTVRGLYYGIATTGVLALAAALTVSLWAHRVDFVRGRRWPMTHTNRAVFCGGVAAAVVLGGALRWNLAHGSLWWDELWNIRQAVVGNWKVGDEPDAAPKFSRATWARAAWYYQKPTNHVPAALAAKVSYEAWAAATDAPDGAVFEFALRLPNFLASLASIIAIAVLVARWGFPTAGIIAAFLLALHPWAVRYGIDMRAYSGLVLLTVLGCLWITCIAHSCGRQWRYWLLFGLNQFLLVWSLPNAIWYAMGFFVALAAVVLRSGGGGRGLVRLAVVNVFAAMALFVVAGPMLVQAYRWLQVIDEPHFITRELLVTTASQLFYGMPYDWAPGRESAGIPTFVRRVGSSDFAGLIAWATPVLLAGAGFVRLALRSRPAVFGTLAVIGSSAAYLIATYSSEQFFYPRYLIYLMVPLVVLIAIAIDGLAKLVARGQPALALGAALVLGVGSYGLFVAPELRMLATRSYAPMREVATWLRTETAGPRRVYGFGLGGRVMENYYPRVRWEGRNSEGAVRNEMAAARAAGEPLYAIYGYASFNRATFPEAAAVLDDPELFEEVAAFPGIEPEFFFRILRFRSEG